MKAWKLVGQQTLVANRWMTLHANRYELPSGLEIEPYDVVEENDWVHVVAIDTNGLVVTVRQYRPAGDLTCTELPAGVVEGGETPEAAARRELSEETGLGAGKMTLVASMYANPARQTNKVHVFLAEDLTTAGEQRLDESEEIVCGLASVDELFEMVVSGEFGQALHVASLGLVERMLRRRALEV